jgi:hypothetical protein
MVEVEMREDLERGPGYWKFNTSLLKDSAYVERIREAWGEMRGHKGEFKDRAEWWNCAKSLVRTISVDYAKKEREKRARMVRALERNQVRLKGEMENGHGSQMVHEELAWVELRLREEEDRKAEGYRIRSRMLHFESGEPGIANFRRMEKTGSKRNLISALRDEAGKLKRGAEGVGSVAHDFYTGLLSKGDTEMGTQDSFLREVDVGLTDEQGERCDAMITHGEAKAVLWKMSPESRLGLMGFRRSSGASSGMMWWVILWRLLIGCVQLAV